MTKLSEAFRRRFAPLSLMISDSINNYAWEFAEIAEKALSSILLVNVSPMKIHRKLRASAISPIKDRFLVSGLDKLPSNPIQSLPTYIDMSDIAQFGDDLLNTRLYQWLKASAAAGRPVEGRGRVFDSEEEIKAYCQTYLELFKSMQQHGYCYTGDDDICLGIAADGEVIHMRRGTHRMATAQILRLSSISARVTHIDPVWAKRFIRSHRLSGRDILDAAIKTAMS